GPSRLPPHRGPGEPSRAAAVRRRGRAGRAGAAGPAGRAPAAAGRRGRDARRAGRDHPGHAALEDLLPRRRLRGHGRGAGVRAAGRSGAAGRGGGGGAGLLGQGAAGSSRPRPGGRGRGGGRARQVGDAGGVRRGIAVAGEPVAECMDAVSRGRVRVEPSAKRVRTYLGGRPVADTTRALLVWEKPYYPTYYLPLEDVDAELSPTGAVEHSPSRGDGIVHTVKAGGAEAADAAVTYPGSPLEPIRGHVRFSWDAMDAWFEEDEQVYVHPRDPYTRVDILPSSRHVRVEVGGVTVADSRH